MYSVRAFFKKKKITAENSYKKTDIKKSEQEDMVKVRVSPNQQQNPQVDVQTAVTETYNSSVRKDPGFRKIRSILTGR